MMCGNAFFFRIALLFLVVLAPVAMGGQLDEALDAHLGSDQAILVISVDTEIPFKAIRIKRPDEVFGDLVAENTSAGKSLSMIVMPAGHYQWTEVLLGTADFERGHIVLNGNKNQNYEFDVQAGKINYPGDFVIQTNFGNVLTEALSHLALPTNPFLFHIRYYIQLRDRMAMLLETLTPEERKAFDRIGFVYIGPGNDAFPDYYEKLAAH
jgi:hypothetical protein